VRDEPGADPRPPDWIAKLRPGEQAKARTLVELLIAAGIHDAEEWVRSELTENIAQTASAMFLRSIWPNHIDPYTRDLGWIEREIAESERHPRGPFADAGAALGRLLSAGADPEDIGRVARLVAYETSYALLLHVGSGADEDVESGPGWRLMEVDQEQDALTGRPILGLHESLLGMDPSGREGSPG
jgi:hypothetical protein